MAAMRIRTQREATEAMAGAEGQSAPRGATDRMARTDRPVVRETTPPEARVIGRTSPLLRGAGVAEAAGVPAARPDKRDLDRLLMEEPVEMLAPGAAVGTQTEP